MKTSLIQQSISHKALAAAAAAVSLLIAGNVSAQDLVPDVIASPRPEQAGATAEVERVIVTGSNIPTAEEVGPAAAVEGHGIGRDQARDRDTEVLARACRHRVMKSHRVG